jgi:putative transposase
LKRSSNPEIVEDLRTWRGNAKPLVGEQVWDVIDDLHREEIDALVEVTFRRRAYRGRRLLDGVQQLEAAVEAGDVSYVSLVARKTG